MKYAIGLDEGNGLNILDNTLCDSLNKIIEKTYKKSGDIDIYCPPVANFSKGNWAPYKERLFILEDIGTIALFESRFNNIPCFDGDDEPSINKKISGDALVVLLGMTPENAEKIYKTIKSEIGDNISCSTFE